MSKHLNARELEKWANEHLPSWIKREAWDALQEARKRKRAVQSAYALGLLLSKLTDMRARGLDPNAAIDQSIERGWISVFDPKPVQRNCPSDSFAETIRAHYSDPRSEPFARH